MIFSKAKPYQNNFIISAPRSGTTWLSNMLNAHPSIFCVERRLFGNYADFIQDEGIDDVRLRVTLDKYVNSIFNHHGLKIVNKEKFTKSLIKTIQKQERLLSGKKILVDKITPYLNTSTTVLNQINTYFPKSNIVFLVRDGRDVLTSGVFHWFNKQHANKELSSFEKQRKEVGLNGCGGKGGFIKPPHKLFFKTSCNHHDFLYFRGCNEAHRLEADTLLYLHMMLDCVDLPWYQWIRYRPWCFLYFLAIRLLGKKFFYYGPEKRYPAEELYEKAM